MKLLLSSVFKPYGVDDAYGRKENIMELFHNQITREQGIFSLRFHHQSFNLHLLAENIAAPTTVLDFPTERRFIREIRKQYDYVGITFIVPTFSKARRMCELIRKYSPESKIILGGQGTKIPGIEQMLEYDHICPGEGIEYIRDILNEEVSKPFLHPTIASAFSKQIFGVPLKTDTAVLIPGLGCPNGCRFCSTSHFFNKQYISFLDTGDAIFQVCQSIEQETGFRDFFIIDENFLKKPERAYRLVELMEKHNKLYRFGIFSSAETIKNVGIEFIARMGVFTLWLGVESKFDIYEKNKGVDIEVLIRSLRDHGINVLASGILFLEHHDKHTIWEDIDFLIDLEADLLQIMQLAPMPGTPLYEDYDKNDQLREEIPYEEWHGQHRIWFKHPSFTLKETEDILRHAFKQDYLANGPSILRMCETAIRGCNTLAHHRDQFMKKRHKTLINSAHSLRPALAVVSRYAENESTKERTRKIMKMYDELLGPVTAKGRLKTYGALTCAAVSIIKAASTGGLRQPRTIVTKYRM